MTVSSRSAEAAGASVDRPVKLACRNVWKVYGKDAASALAGNGGTLSAEELVRAGLIGAVRDCSVSVREVQGRSGTITCTLRTSQPSRSIITLTTTL